MIAGTRIPRLEKCVLVAPPFACVATATFEHFRESDFLARHIAPFFTFGIGLCPSSHTTALRIPAGQNQRSGWAAYVVCISLRDTGSGLRQLIHDWCVEILRAVAVRIECALMVCIKMTTLGFLLRGSCLSAA
jgi:hypothetical protein